MKIFLYILVILYGNYSLFSQQLEDIIGNITLYTIKKDETLIDISRRYNLAFPEVLLTNPDIDDPWLLEEGKVISLPTRHLLPNGKRKGIIINKGVCSWNKVFLIKSMVQMVKNGNRKL